MRFSDPDAALVAIATIALLANGAALSSERTPFAAPEHEGAPVIGELDAVHGRARSHGAGVLVWSTVRSRDEVRLGDAVFTGPDAQLTVRLLDGSTLELGPSTFVVIGGADERPSIRLARGSIGGVAGPAGLRIEAGPTHADFAARAEAAVHVSPSRSRIEVDEGRVDVATATRDAVEELASRDAIDVDAAGVPSRFRLPVALLSPATGATFRFRGPLAAVALAWSPHEARDLRLEVARDPDFGDLALSARVSSATRSFSPPRAGAYRWRLVGPDGTAVSETRSFLVLEERAPVLAQPLEDEVVFVGTGLATTLAWRATEPVRVEVAADASFDSPAFVRDGIAGDRVAFVPLAGEGRWLWRVRAARADAPWSEARPFRVTRVDGNSAPVHLNVEIHVDAP